MIELKNAAEIEKIRAGGKIVAEVLSKLKSMVEPGLPTSELDAEARKITKRLGARPAFLNYRGYPAAVCVSLNSEVVHGIPGKKRVIKQGDLVSIDFGVEYEGFFADSALTAGAGSISEKARKLMETTRKSLEAGIAMAQPGNRVHDISAAVQEYAEKNGYSVVRDFVGHGIGRKLHEEPQVPNFGTKGTGPVLKPGTVIAIEPMVNEKGYEIKILDDEWTVVTADGGLSAHFEHTVAVTEQGPVILT